MGHFFGVAIPLLFIFLIFRIGMRYLNAFFYDEHPGAPHFRGRPGGSGAYRLGQTVTEARVFRLAYKLKGRITVSDLVVETGTGLQEAEEMLNSLVDGLRVRQEVTEKGLVVYEFPEIIARFEGGGEP